MPPTIKIGTVMMQAGTLVPDCMRIEAEPYSHSWELISNSGGDKLDRQVRNAGWNLFFMAANLQVIGWGHSSGKSIHTAMKRMLVKATASGFNCLEVTEIAAKRFLGVPYMRLSAHSRHIQQSSFLRPGQNGAN
jgi:hypothetical protein